MKHNVGFIALVVVTLLVSGVPVAYHEVPGGQDPYAHLLYANEILDTGGLSTDVGWIHETGLDSFPAFHILFAALRFITGFGDWGVYTILMMALSTLTIIFLYLIGENLFDRKVGLLAGFFTAFSFFFISHLYVLGLTYNLLMVLLGLMALYYLLEGRDRDVAVTVFPLAASHVFSIIFLVPILIMSRGRRMVTAASSAALLYPIGFLLSRALSGQVLEITAPRNPLGVYLSFVTAMGGGTLMALGVFVLFFGASIYLGITRKGNHGKVFLMTGAVFLGWLFVSLPFMASRGLTLYETDRFLFYAVFPLALAGAAACFEFKGRIRNALVAVILLISLSSTYVMADYNARVPYAVEQSMDGLMVLAGVVEESDKVATNELQWVSYYGGCQVARPQVISGSSKAFLLESPDILYSLSPDELFGFMNASEKTPRYVFLGYNDIKRTWPVVEWFIMNSGPEYRFDIAYFDGNSMIIRPVYFDIEYARSVVMAQAEGAVDVAIVDSYDALPGIPGEESWFASMQVEGEMERYVVSKETGEVTPWG